MIYVDCEYTCKLKADEVTCIVAFDNTDYPYSLNQLFIV